MNAGEQFIPSNLVRREFLQIKMFLHGFPEFEGLRRSNSGIFKLWHPTKLDAKLGAPPISAKDLIRAESQIFFLPR